MKKICKLAGTMIFFALLCGCSVESGQAQPPEPTQNTSITASEADHAVLSDAPTADNTVLEKDLSGYEPAPFSSAAFETASARNDWYDNGVFSAYYAQALPNSLGWEYAVTITGDLDPNPYDYDGYDIYRVHIPSATDQFFAVPYSRNVTAVNVFAYDAASNQVKLVFADGNLISDEKQQTEEFKQVQAVDTTLPYVDCSIPVFGTQHSIMLQKGDISFETEISLTSLTTFLDLNDGAVYYSAVGTMYYGVCEDQNVAFLMAGLQDRVKNCITDSAFFETPPLILQKSGSEHRFLCWQLQNGVFILETYGLDVDWSDDIAASLIYADSTERVALFQSEQ